LLLIVTIGTLAHAQGGTLRFETGIRSSEGSPGETKAS
jgi:hypothetical protein